MDSLLASGGTSSGADVVHRWTFVTNHFLVLVCVAGEPDLRVRDIAGRVGITERATQAILSDLVGEGYVERTRTGRRNRYEVRSSATLRHPLVEATTIGEVIDIVLAHDRTAAG
jgi:DNA-binding MarR family transcriptional regulator